MFQSDSGWLVSWLESDVSDLPRLILRGQSALAPRSSLKRQPDIIAQGVDGSLCTELNLGRLGLLEADEPFSGEPRPRTSGTKS